MQTFKNKWTSILKEDANNLKRFVMVGALEHLKTINERICFKQSSRNHVTANTYCMCVTFWHKRHFRKAYHKGEFEESF